MALSLNSERGREKNLSSIPFWFYISIFSFNKQALKDEEIQKRQLEKIRAKQNPLARKLKLVKNSNQPKRTKLKGPKELFEQVSCYYS